MCISSSILGILCGYVFPPVAAFGLVTNILTAAAFLIFWPSPLRRPMIYFGALAIADGLCLISIGWMWMFPAKGLPFVTNGRVSFFTFAVSEQLCRFHRFFFCFSSSLATNLLLLACLDRTVAIFYPTKALTFSPKHAINGVIVTILITALLALPISLNAGWFIDKGGTRQCWLKNAVFFTEIINIALNNNGLIQTLVIVGLNIAMVVKLYYLEDHKSSKDGPKRREVKAALILVVISCLFLTGAVLQASGYLLAHIFNYYGVGHQKDLIRLAYNISDIGWQIFFWQESVTWLLYMKQMSTFRVAMSSMCCGWTICHGCPSRVQPTEASLSMTGASRKPSDARISRAEMVSTF